MEGYQTNLYTLTIMYFSLDFEDLLCSVLISLKCYLLDKITVGLHELPVNIWKELGRKVRSLEDIYAMKLLYDGFSFSMFLE